MSRIRANTITNQNANGAPNFPDGITVTGIVTATTTSQNITGDLTVTGNVGIAGTLTYEDVTNVDAIGIITARSGIKIGATGANTLISGNSTGIGINQTPTRELSLHSPNNNNALFFRILLTLSSNFFQSVKCSNISNRIMTSYFLFVLKFSMSL